MNKMYLIGAFIVAIVVVLWATGAFASKWEEDIETENMYGTYGISFIVHLSDGSTITIDSDSPPSQTWWYGDYIITGIDYCLNLKAELINDEYQYTQYEVTKNGLTLHFDVTDSDGNVDYTYPGGSFTGTVTLDIGEMQNLNSFTIDIVNSPSFQNLAYDTYTVDFWTTGAGTYKLIGESTQTSWSLPAPEMHNYIEISKTSGGLLMFTWGNAVGPT